MVTNTFFQNASKTLVIPLVSTRDLNILMERFATKEYCEALVVFFEEDFNWVSTVLDFLVGLGYPVGKCLELKRTDERKLESLVLVSNMLNFAVSNIEDYVEIDVVDSVNSPELQKSLKGLGLPYKSLTVLDYDFEGEYKNACGEALDSLGFSRDKSRKFFGLQKLKDSKPYFDY